MLKFRRPTYDPKTGKIKLNSIIYTDTDKSYSQWRIEMDCISELGFLCEDKVYKDKNICKEQCQFCKNKAW
jgi:hypothetical protein